MSYNELAATGWKLNLQSTIYPGADKKKSNKTTYVCKECDITLWGKPEVEVICKECLLSRLAFLPWLDEGKTEDLIAEIYVSESVAAAGSCG